MSEPKIATESGKTDTDAVEPEIATNNGAKKSFGLISTFARALYFIKYVIFFPHLFNLAFQTPVKQLALLYAAFSSSILTGAKLL